MGEKQKVEEPKAEEAKPEEKIEENAEEKPAAKEKKEEPKPPSPFVLLVDLHCVGCAKKIEKSLLRIAGVVGVDTDMVKNQVTIKGVVEPQAVCDKIMKKTKRNAKVLSPEGESIPQEVASEVPGLTTVELNVSMHCEACAQQLKRIILRMKGVRRVETEVSSGKVMVTGSMEGEKLVDYVYRHTRKQAKIVPQPEPEPEPEPEPVPAPEPEPEKPKEEAAAKVDEKTADQEPKLADEEEKKEGGSSGGGDEGEKEKMKALGDEQSMQRIMYYHQYPPLYMMERIPPPQLFSDENPNACSIS